MAAPVLQELSQLHRNLSSLEAYVTQVAASLAQPPGSACNATHDLVRLTCSLSLNSGWCCHAMHQVLHTSS